MLSQNIQMIYAILGPIRMFNVPISFLNSLKHL